jgi:hypothetical protein
VKITEEKKMFANKNLNIYFASLHLSLINFAFSFNPSKQAKVHINYFPQINATFSLQDDKGFDRIEMLMQVKNRS